MRNPSNINPNDVFPRSNLPGESVEWGRQLMERVQALESARVADSAFAQGQNRNTAAVTASLADQLVQIRTNYPVGAVIMYSALTAPIGWLVCDGSAVSRDDYSDLFSVVGVNYGNGDGSTTFNLPNLMGRVVVGVDPSQPEFNSLGETGGAKTHTLTIGEMPSHTHTQNPHNHTQASHSHSYDNYEGFSGGSGGLLGVLRNASGSRSTSSVSPTINSTTATNQDTGGGAAHNNLQPYLTMPYIIKHALL